MTNRFILSEAITYRREWFGGITYSDRTKETRFFNHAAALLVEQFARPLTIRGAEEVVEPLINGSSGSEFCEWLENEQIIERVERERQSTGRLFFTEVTEFPNDRLFAPLGVELELTLRCLRRCLYCAYDSSPSVSTTADLNAEQYRSILSLLRANGILSVRFTGGDPLTRSDCLEIFQEADEAGFPFMVASDLTALTDKQATRLGQFENLLAVQTTLDGPTPDIADAMRGAGNHSRVTRGIQLLRSRSVPVIVGTILTKLNVHAIYETAKVLSKFDVAFCVSPLYAAGRGRALAHLIPDEDDLADAYQQFDAAVKNGLVRAADPAWSLVSELGAEARRALWAGQPWLVRSPDRLMRVDPSGRCYTSIHLKEVFGDDVYIGQIRDSADLLAMWHQAPLLARLRNSRQVHPYYGDVIDIRDLSQEEVVNARS